MHEGPCEKPDLGEQTHEIDGSKKPEKIIFKEKAVSKPPSKQMGGWPEIDREREKQERREQQYREERQRREWEEMERMRQIEEKRLEERRMRDIGKKRLMPQEVPKEFPKNFNKRMLVQEAPMVEK